MKTLIIISHPDIRESSSQQYLLSSIPGEPEVTVHHLEEKYPDFKIDSIKEQELIAAHDRIILQFPLYWYSSPPLLKKWQDEVLTENFAYGKNGHHLQDKEFGLVLTIGASKNEYQAGGKEHFSITELTKPFQAMALKTGMIYLKPLSIHQFSYLTEEQKMELLIEYQLLLTHEKDTSLASRENWFLNQLEQTDLTTLAEEDSFKLQHVMEIIEENRETMDDLKLSLEEME